ncbi:MAG: N-acetylmuramoyl-L-alanine amidase [Clostridia bacterium]|nr:N-acetylmuramoyl-L-alanine amidase [Clostridia bacterium]
MTDTESGWNAPEYVVYVPLVKNEFSRPGTPLTRINGIVVHYVANPGTTAEQNRSYFNGLAQSGATWASSHFIIGLEGEVLQLIPLDEIAYCSNNRNDDTVSIECCHPEEDGKFTDKTYDSLITLLTDLCREYDLDPRTQIIRHYDVNGKMCPLYFVEHEDAWHELLTDVAAALTASPAGK